MSTGKVVLGTLAGIATGAILGILFAPDKGSVTRKQIMDRGNGYVDGLKSKYNEFADSVSEKLQGAREDLEGMAENSKSKFQDMKQDMKKDAQTTASGYKS
jgi:gas vesicle protein